MFLSKDSNVKAIHVTGRGSLHNPIGLHGLLRGYLLHLLFNELSSVRDRLCGPVVRVLGYRSGGSGSIPGTIKKKSNVSGTGCTQPREYN
jgi:hypothetical protein